MTKYISNILMVVKYDFFFLLSDFRAHILVNFFKNLKIFNSFSYRHLSVEVHLMFNHDEVVCFINVSSMVTLSKLF